MRRLVLTGILVALFLAASVYAESPRLGGGLGNVRPTSIHTPLQRAWIALRQSPDLRRATVSAYAVDLTTGQTLASIHPTWLETPASVMKLFTSVRALAALGTSHTYLTQAGTSPTTPGVLFLVGGGDPWLNANGAGDLEALASTVAPRISSAVRVVGVNTWSVPLYGVGWPIGDLSYGYASGISSLMAERSSVFLTVTAASKPGLAPAVSLSFGGPAVSLPGRWAFRIINHAVTGPAKSRLTLNIIRLIGSNTYVVKGSLPMSGKPLPAQEVWPMSVGNPALFAAAIFQSALTADGVHFTGTPSAGTLPSGSLTVLGQHASPPLSTYLPIQNQFSINQMADNLYQVAKEASTPLTAADLSPPYVQVDGSGLSPTDALSAQDVVRLLSWSAHQPWFPVLQGSLMHLNTPGACGFLCHHYPLAPGTSVAIKTGNLNNQWNIAGYVRLANGNLVAFAILDDGPPTSLNAHRGSAVFRMLTTLTEWPHVPSPAPSGLPYALRLALPTGVAGALARLHLPHPPGSVTAITVTNAATGQIVWQRHGHLLMRAGLLPRLGLAAALLARGPAGFPNVRVDTTGTVGAGGVLHGALILDGGGDPSVTTASLAALAEAVHQHGITAITGGVSYLNPETGWIPLRWPGGLPWEEVGQRLAPPRTRLLVNHGQVTVHVKMNATGMAQITISPPDAPVTVINQVTRGTVASVRASLQMGQDRYVLTGTMPPGSQTTLQVAPPDPGLIAASLFRDELRSLHIKVPQSVRPLAALPAKAQALAALPGPSLQANLPALLGTANSTAAMEWLQLWQATHAQVPITRSLLLHWPEVADPTGMALENYLSADSMGRLLSTIWTNPKEAALKAWLGSSWWQAHSIGTDQSVAFVRTPSGTVLAVTVMVSGLGWNGQYAPGVARLSP